MFKVSTPLDNSVGWIIGEKDIVDHRGKTVRYTGQLVMGEATGFGTYTDEVGTVFTGQFCRDMKHGTGK